MGVIKRRAKLVQKRSNFGRRGQRFFMVEAVLKPVRQCGTRQQAHNDVRPVFVRAKIVDRHDMVVFQRRGSFSFADKAFDVAGLRSERRGEDLQRDRPFQP